MKKKDIKKNGKTIASLEFDGKKWKPVNESAPETIEEKMVLLAEQSDEFMSDVMMEDVLRVLSNARYFTSANMSEYSRSSGECMPYNGVTNKISISECEVSITGSEISVTDGDKSFTLDIEDVDSYNIYGGNTMRGIDENGNKLVGMNFSATVDSNEKGNIEYYDLYFTYAMPK